MPTYVYETIPQKAGDQPVRFEWQQSMKDAPLTKHPDTGTPVRRVIASEFNVVEKTRPPRSSSR